MYGIEGIQNYIREHVRLARKFESLVKSDNRFEVVNDVLCGLVCFRIKGNNELNKRLLTKINACGRLHMVPASLNNKFVIRFCVCAEKASDRDIVVAFEIIKQTAVHILEQEEHEPTIEEAEEGDKEGEDDSAQMEYVPRDKQNESIAYKRSFLVRMVSDPKCYNPKIIRTSTLSKRRLSEDLRRDLSIRCDLEEGTAASVSNDDDILDFNTVESTKYLHFNSGSTSADDLANEHLLHKIDIEDTHITSTPSTD